VSNANAGAEKVGFFSRVGRGYRNMRGEMKRIVWPSRKQVINNTGIVLFFMAICAVVIGGFDALLSWIARLVFGA